MRSGETRTARKNTQPETKDLYEELDKDVMKLVKKEKAYRLSLGKRNVEDA